MAWAMLTLEKKEKLHNKAVRVAERFTDPAQREAFIDLVDEVVEEVYEVEREKSSRSELRELIIEMREGFRRMDERFDAVDKRFEDMYKHFDKRFEDMYKHFDKRFEDMYKHLDKRFEAVDKRFEDMHKRFAALQWMIAIGFSILTLIMSYATFFKQSPDTRMEIRELIEETRKLRLGMPERRGG